MRKGKRAIALAVLLVLLGAVSHPSKIGATGETANIIAPPRVDSPSCVVMDAVSGKVLFEKDARTKRNPASVTKVMTLVLAFEDIASGRAKLTDQAVTSENAWEMGGTEVWAEPGEVMSLDEWLKAVAVASANDAAVIVAEHLAGTEEGFVARMNQRAAELGMVDTTFQNPHGLDAPGHVTSAMDLALLSRHATSVPHLLDYTKIYMQEFRGGKNMLTNFNKMVYLYDGCDGLKTGFTSQSGYCVSVTAQRDGSRFVVVLMGAETPDMRQNDAWRLLDWSFANFRSLRILDKDERIGQAKVLKGKVDEIAFVSETSFAVTLNKGDTGEVRRVISLDKVVAPVKKGDAIGTMAVEVDGVVAATVPLVAAEDVGRASYLDYALKYLRAFTIGK